MLLSGQICHGQEVLELRYAQTASTWRSIFSLPMRIAEKEGFYAAHGLRFEMVPIVGGAETSLVALEEQKADVAHVATSFLITAALRGADTVAIIAEFNNPIYSLVAKPWYKTIGELRGRRIGMAAMIGDKAKRPTARSRCLFCMAISYQSGLAGGVRRCRRRGGNCLEVSDDGIDLGGLVHMFEGGHMGHAVRNHLAQNRGVAIKRGFIQLWSEGSRAHLLRQVANRAGLAENGPSLSLHGRQFG
jgi:hypothetical protein